MSAKSTKKAAVKAAPNKENPATTAGFCVYIGPTVVGVIQNGSVLRGNKQEALRTVADAVDKYPLIASLIVSGDTLAVDRIKVKTPGNLLYVHYHKMLAGIK